MKSNNNNFLYIYNDQYKVLIIYKYYFQKIQTYYFKYQY